MKIKFLVFAFAVFMFCQGCSSMGISKDVKPNVIFILVDDLGWADLGYNSSKMVTTANISPTGLLTKQSIS